MTSPKKMVWLCFALGVLSACERAADEPMSAKPRASSPAAPTLTWTVPPTWNVERTANTGEYRAKYTIPSTGDAKHTAELLVSRVGTESVDDKLDALLHDFEGPGVENAKREEKQVGGFVVKLLDVGATYKFPMGPPMGPQKKVPAHVMKENWRALAAGVETKDRGNWFFRLVGPNDAVEGARSAFVSMLDGLH